MSTTSLRVLTLAALIAVGTGPALGQVLTHSSLCHPEGSTSYPPGDTITFRYHAEDDPAFADALAVPPCVGVRLEAKDVRGFPPLTRHWTTEEGLSLFGNPVELDTGVLGSGLHFIRFTVSNLYGSASMTTTVVVTALDEPPAAPTADEDPSPDLTVAFEAVAAGAHEWRWTFGDGSGATGWMEHPCHYHASTVTHTFPRAGTYPVVATARNCLDGQLASEALLVEVGSPDAITLTHFEATDCEPVFCTFFRDELVAFDVEASAVPERYLWDWDGDGVVDQVTEDVVGHRYGEFGVYSPRLTVERGSASSTLTHERLLLVQ